MANKNEKKELIHQHNRRLQLLEEQTAKLGFDTPRGMDLEIKDIKSRIKHLQQENNSYIAIEQWKIYFETLKNGIDPSIDIIEELDNGYEVELYAAHNLDVKREFKEFIYSTSSLKILIIKGHAGCGKSVFLHHQTRELAANLLPEIRTELESPTFSQPIPIFLSVRTFSIKAGDALEDQIINDLRRSNLLNLPKNLFPEDIFEIWNNKWIILLDGLDEITENDRKELWKQIKRVAKFQNIKFVITIRTGTKLDTVKGITKQINILPLTKQQIKSYLYNRIERDKNVDTKLEIIKTFIDYNSLLWQHLQIPLLLKIAGDYFYRLNLSTEDGNLEQKTGDENEINNIENLVSSRLNYVLDTSFDEFDDEKFNHYLKNSNEEKPKDEIKLGVLLDRLFAELWSHNEKKIAAGMNLDKYHTYSNLGKMARYKMVDSNKIKKAIAKHYLEDALEWMLDLGILYNTQIKVFFPTSLAKQYFVAFFLMVELEDRQANLDIFNDVSEFWKSSLLLIKQFAPNHKGINMGVLEKQIKILQGV